MNVKKSQKISKNKKNPNLYKTFTSMKKKSRVDSRLYRNVLPGSFLHNQSPMLEKILFLCKLLIKICKDKIYRLFGIQNSSREFQVKLIKDSNQIILQDLSTDHALGLKLWRNGFFGKGSLSRGEPTWWIRIQNGNKLGESIASQRRHDSLPDHKRNVVYENDLEEYQLMPEETFFLSQAVDVLQVISEESDGSNGSNDIHNAYTLWNTFCNQSMMNSNLKDPTLKDIPNHYLIQHFAIRYAVYHYYRSKGWIVRCGVKFGTDYVLYQKGPVFRHAEYSVLILPQWIESQKEEESLDSNIKQNEIHSNHKSFHSACVCQILFYSTCNYI